MKILLNVLAVVVGVALAQIVIIALQTLSYAMFEVPAHLQPATTPEQLLELVQLIPIKAYLVVLVGYLTGSFIGGGIAAMIAQTWKVGFGILIGVLIAVGCIINHFVSLPGQPIWFILLSILGCVPMAWLATKVVVRGEE